MNDEKKKYIGLNTLTYYNSLIKLALSKKVDKVEGKGLSTNDLTDELKEKIMNAGDSSFSGNYDDLINKPTIPSNNNQLTNGAGYQTANDVQVAINSALANVNKKEIVTSLEEMTNENTIYLIANDGNDNNIYDEYLIINNIPEKIGSTAVDLTGYLKNTDLVEITNAEIDQIVGE